MRASVASLIAGLMVFGGFTGALAANLKEKVKVEIEGADRQPGMEPGMYVCAAGHLHIMGTVQNVADVALGRIKVAGKAFDSEGKLLGTATASTTQPKLKPGEKAGFDLEFVNVTGASTTLISCFFTRSIRAEDPGLSSAARVTSLRTEPGV